MACSRCSAHARLLSAAARPTRLLPIAARFQTRAQSTKPSAPEGQSPKAAPPEGEYPDIDEVVKNAPKAPSGVGLMGTYAIYQGTEKIYKVVAKPAAYSISTVDRHNGNVEQLPDGEELGVSEGPWHKLLDLPPTFSTWSQVTMLRMYLLVARARCLSPDAYQSWYRQLLDHFFFDCERLMDVNHDLSSKTVRQRFLKDIFVQWRGVVAAYDEGIARGDAVLGSAVWRNLYKGRSEVDFRRVAGVVSYIRGTLWELERKTNGDFMVGRGVFKGSLEAHMRAVEAQVKPKNA